MKKLRKISIISKSLNGLIELEGLQNLSSLCRFNTSRYPFLLESCSGKNNISALSKTSRYDILFAFPQERLILKSEAHVEGPFSKSGRTFLDSLDLWRNDLSGNPYENEKNLPFTGGWFLMLSYELAGQFESVLHLPVSKNNFPVAAAVRIPACIINDYKENRSYIFAENQNKNMMESILFDLEAASKTSSGEYRMYSNAQNFTESNLTESFPGISLYEENKEKYLRSSRQAVDYIHAGDVFQVNLSRLWKGDIPDNLSSHAIYENLKISNPAPFSGFASFDEGDIISSSPERLIEVRNGIIQTRPIAGTRPRGMDDLSNSSEKEYLKTNPKELAEHRMLIDLERNDLGKVCSPGSIRIDENMIIEEFAHVNHIVSNISGKIKDNITPGNIIRAVFPGGTITGCPKIRCMQIIAELEREARGPYTGSMGYLSINGDMDLNILIRTFFREKNSLSFRAGAGIVADSVPEKELEETRAKAKGLLLALKYF